jgi:hypothetical protein
LLLHEKFGYQIQSCEREKPMQDKAGKMAQPLSAGTDFSRDAQGKEEGATPRGA